MEGVEGVEGVETAGGRAMLSNDRLDRLTFYRTRKDIIMAGCFELKLAKNGEFYFNLLAGNGQNILKSEMYGSKSAAENGIASVQTNSGEDGQYECKESTSGKPYFVLKAKNHQIIGQSQMYEGDSGCQGGIDSCKENGSTETIKDLSEG
ncbi:MAG: hypothetical protein ACI9NT_001304 [Bacteroidia bacterium]